VASYSWLSDFDLLKYSRTDIMQKPWSVPANREVANKYFKVLRAHEEIHRLNIEVRRLDAWTIHEDEKFESAIDTETDPHLAAELRRHYAERRRVNRLHRIRISSIYSLEGYSGPGPFVPEENMGENQFCSGEELIDEDDDVEDEVLRLGDFLDSLSIY
jgi:IS4 transposase